MTRSPSLTWLFINSASGSCDTDVAARVCRALESAGHAVERIVDAQDRDCPSPAELDAAGAGVLAVLSGDGTANAAVAALDGWSGSVLVLPGGTANLLARALHGDGTAAEIAARAARMQPRRQPCLRWSGGLCLIEALAGPGAVWSDVREVLRDGDLAGVAATGAEALRHTLSGPVVRLVDPAIGREAGYPGLRMVPEEAGIAVSGYGAETMGDLVKQGFALLRRDYRTGPHDALGHHAQVVCESSDGEGMALMIDGERRHGRAKERFSLAELPVNLLAQM